MNRDRLIKELGLRAFGQQGWLASEDLECPACGKVGKVGISVTNRGGTIHCFKCSNSESLFRYLKSIGRSDLIGNKQEYSLGSKLLNLYEEVEEEESTLKEVKLPYGSKRLQSSEYLNSRGFLPQHYALFTPLVTTHFLEKRLHDTIIFCMYQKNVLVGIQARSTLSKDWHEQNLRELKEKKAQLKLRWQCSTGVDFTRILGGYDEITENTHTVILCEGLFDKIGTDNIMRLLQQDDIKCCFTFGNKISEHQVGLLMETNVQTVILFYDFGTVKIVKGFAMMLQKYFDVYVAEITDNRYDPGDMPKELMLQIFRNLQTPMDYYIGRL